jgi:hypothetical protein
MSALGQKRTSQDVDGMSAIPPKADMVSAFAADAWMLRIALNQQ